MYNGYTKTPPYAEKVKNLLSAIPESNRPAAIADAWIAAQNEIHNASRHDFLRHLETFAWQSMAHVSADYDLPAPVIISGGEVLELSQVSNPDEEIPF